MAQRFGPYSFVVNTNKVSRAHRRGSGLESLERSGQCEEIRCARQSETGTSLISAASPASIPSKTHSDDEVAKFTETAEARCSRAPSWSATSPP